MEEVNLHNFDINTELFRSFGNKRVFTEGEMVGEGSLIALKICLQVIEKPFIVFAPGSASKIVTGKPSIMVGKNAAAVASGVSRSINDATVVCFAGDRVTREKFNSILSCAQRNENFIYICANNMGGSYTELAEMQPSFSRYLRSSYVATASVAFIEDYVNKLKKAVSMTGFRFIDVLCPSPKVGGFDTSNTVQVARAGVDSKMWPLYEIDGTSKPVITRRPNPQPVDRFLDAQETFRKISGEERHKLQQMIDKSWKLLNDGIVV